MSKEQPRHPDIDVTLSRPTYRLGGTVVGTVRITTTRPSSSSTTTICKSLLLSGVGYCRLDPRWHHAADLDHQFDQFLDTAVEHHLPEDLPMPSHTAPFWATNCIDLMGLKERKEGSWEETRPKPIILPGRKAIYEERRPELQAVLRSQATKERVNLEDSQLAFSFRVDLPVSAPHTLSATSCRYYYAIALRLETTTTSEEPCWMLVPVTVLTADPTGERDTVDAPPLQAMAHSSGLPTKLTTTELHKFDGQWTVNRRGAALYRTVQGVQSMRVDDPNSGRPACVLTIIGAAMLYPGSRLLLKLDFPSPEQQYDNMDSEKTWVPCYQASACLQGEEVAISRSGARKRTRRHLFDTANEILDPDTTECVTLSLVLPPSAPCSVSTDSVEISVQCLIDISVGTETGDAYRNLRLEIPCRVEHGIFDWERNDEENADDSPGKRAFEELLESGMEQINAPNDPRSFRYKDIQDELKILSLSMADTCGLRPKPAAFQETM